MQWRQHQRQCQHLEPQIERTKLVLKAKAEARRNFTGWGSSLIIGSHVASRLLVLVLVLVLVLFVRGDPL